jgi:hypothetical protein
VRPILGGEPRWTAEGPARLLCELRLLVEGSVVGVLVFGGQGSFWSVECTRRCCKATQTAMGYSTSAIALYGPMWKRAVRIYSVFISPIVPTKALSASPTIPMDCRIPSTARDSEKCIVVYWLPGSES